MCRLLSIENYSVAAGRALLIPAAIMHKVHPMPAPSRPHLTPNCASRDALACAHTPQAQRIEAPVNMKDPCQSSFWLGLGFELHDNLAEMTIDTAALARVGDVAAPPPAPAPAPAPAVASGKKRGRPPNQPRPEAPPVPPRPPRASLPLPAAPHHLPRPGGRRAPAVDDPVDDPLFNLPPAPLPAVMPAHQPALRQAAGGSSRSAASVAPPPAPLPPPPPAAHRQNYPPSGSAVGAHGHPRSLQTTADGGPAANLNEIHEAEEESERDEAEGSTDVYIRKACPGIVEPHLIAVPHGCVPAMADVWQRVPEEQLEHGHTVQCSSCRRVILIARDQADAADGVALDLSTA